MLTIIKVALWIPIDAGIEVQELCQFLRKYNATDSSFECQRFKKSQGEEGKYGGFIYFTFGKGFAIQILST